jgi:hypothetical protein
VLLRGLFPYSICILYVTERNRKLCLPFLQPDRWFGYNRLLSGRSLLIHKSMFEIDSLLVQNEKLSLGRPIKLMVDMKINNVDLI